MLGIVGAFVGGWLFTRLGYAGVTGLNIYSLVVAVIGAIIVLLIYHMAFARRCVNWRREYFLPLRRTSRCARRGWELSSPSPARTGDFLPA